MIAQATFGGVGGIAVGVYLALLVALTLASRKAKRSDSPSDFYLAGRSVGTGVLFLTLFATQYSGLTFVGFVGSAYRSGYLFLVCVPFTMSIVGAYLFLAPRLHERSRRRRYVTAGDFVQDRYGTTSLTMVTSAVFVFALASYILTNVKAIGVVVAELSDGQITPLQAMIGFSVLMVLYETAGGLRAVAWTDAVQGIILLLGCLTLSGVVTWHYGGFESIGAKLSENQSQFWDQPTAAQSTRWASTLFLVAAGASVYPHAIQRIYAAVNGKALRRSLQLMVWMPFLTMLPMVWIGIVGAAQFPGLDRAASEGVMPMVLQDVISSAPVFRFLFALLACSVVAAIMSTADSALLAISSIVAQDFYRRARPATGAAALTRVGKLTSWLLMAVLVALAASLSDTLWRITEVKLQALCQVAPTMYLGLHTRKIDGKAILSGLLVGLGVTLGLEFSLANDPLEIHAGVWGLAANVGTVWLVSLLRSHR